MEKHQLMPWPYTYAFGLAITRSQYGSIIYARPHHMMKNHQLMHILRQKWEKASADARVINWWSGALAHHWWPTCIIWWKGETNHQPMHLMRQKRENPSADDRNINWLSGALAHHWWLHTSYDEETRITHQVTPFIINNDLGLLASLMRADAHRLMRPKLP